MAWQLVQGRRGRRQDANKNAELATSLLKSLFTMSRPAQNRPERTCTRGCLNFSDRKACRRCGAPKKPHQPGLKKTPPTKGPPTRGAAPESSVAPVPPKPWPARLDSSETARRPAPEAAAAEAEARAAALEQSAAQLRAVGLTSQAESLEQQASAERKSADSAPPAGKRLDLLEGFLRRAEGRLAKAAKRVEDAEVELAAARSARDALDSELNNGREQLAKLKKELTEGMAPAADAEAAAAEADAEATRVGGEATDAIARARSHVEAGGPPLTLRVYQLSAALGEALFQGRQEPPTLDAVLDQPTAFFVQDGLQRRVRESAVAEARKAARASPAPAAPETASSDGARTPR